MKLPEDVGAAINRISRVVAINMLTKENLHIQRQSTLEFQCQEVTSGEGLGLLCSIVSPPELVGHYMLD